MLSRTDSPFGNFILYHKVKTSYKNGQDLQETKNLSILYRTAHEAAMMHALSNLQTQVLWYKQLQDIQDTFKNAANSHDLEYLNVGIT